MRTQNEGDADHEGLDARLSELAERDAGQERARLLGVEALLDAARAHHEGARHAGRRRAHVRDLRALERALLGIARREPVPGAARPEQHGVDREHEQRSGEPRQGPAARTGSR
jgi:hypothetical protein